MLRALRFELDWNVNVPDVPEKVPFASARKNRPAKAAGSVGGTELPRPSDLAAPRPCHVIRKLTVAGTSAGLASTTETSCTSTSSRLPPWLTTIASSGIGTV
jgi:hypothetical protein